MRCLPLLALLAGCAAPASPPLQPAAAAAPASTPAPSSPSPCALAARERERIPALLRDGRLDRASRVLLRAASLCPMDQPRGWSALVQVLAELGRGEEARRLADQIDAVPSAPAEARRAASAARALLVARSAPPDGVALAEAGFTALAAGDAAGGRRSLDRALVALEHATRSTVTLIPFDALPSSGSALPTRDGRSLVVAEATSVDVVDARTQRARLVLPGHDLAQASLVLRGDDGAVAAVRMEGVDVWDLVEARPVATIAVPRALLAALSKTQVAFSASSDSEGGPESLLVHALPQGSLAFRVVMGATERVQELAFDGDHVVAVTTSLARLSPGRQGPLECDEPVDDHVAVRIWDALGRPGRPVARRELATLRCDHVPTCGEGRGASGGRSPSRCDYFAGSSLDTRGSRATIEVGILGGSITDRTFSIGTGHLLGAGEHVDPPSAPWRGFRYFRPPRPEPLRAFAVARDGSTLAVTADEIKLGAVDEGDRMLGTRTYVWPSGGEPSVVPVATRGPNTPSHDDLAHLLAARGTPPDADDGRLVLTTDRSPSLVVRDRGGKELARLARVYGRDAWIATTPSLDAIELAGADAGDVPTCAVGPYRFAFALCEDRFRVRGMIHGVLRGDDAWNQP